MKCKDVLSILRITRPTLTSYVKKGIIKVTIKPNSQYDYDEESVYNFLNKQVKRKNVIYARVSTKGQKADLENQTNSLRKFCLENGTLIDEVFSDISSGMDYNRTGFEKLLDDVIHYKIDKIFVTYKDRFGRIGFRTLEKLFSSFGTKIIVISDNGITKDTEKEFIEELVSMIHSFSMKMYSARRKKKLELISKDLELEKDVSL